VKASEVFKRKKVAIMYRIVVHKHILLNEKVGNFCIFSVFHYRSFNTEFGSNVAVEMIARFFVFGRSWIQISARRPVILSKASYFPESLQAIVEVVPQSRPRLVTSTSF
jgi:hypothetical protein